MPSTKRRKLSPPGDGGKDTQSAFYQQAAGWNLEQDYEQRPRKKKAEKENTRLPIKTAEGRIEQLQVQERVREDLENWFQPQDANETEPAPKPEETKIPWRQQILDAKEKLAKLATSINEDPEEHAGAFKALGSIADTKNPTIKRLALATQFAVYKDVIPGYRIRPIAEENQTEKASRDVKRLRAFEQALVSSYQIYLRDLANCASKSSKDQSEAAVTVATTALNCVCDLLLAVPHFNFRGELLKILVGKVSGRKTDHQFIKSRDTLIHFFRDDDDDGTRSLDAVGLLTRMIKARNYQVQESVLNTFLHLRLLTEFSSKASQNSVDKTDLDGETVGKKAKAKREFRTKKYRKILKERKEVEKDFREADAIVSHEQRDRMQAETIKMVFVTYFRILKARIPNLMGAVLEGLAKYAHLINQDFFGDLLEALKDLIKDAQISPDHLDMDDEEAPDEEETTTTTTTTKTPHQDTTRSILLCITTAFTLLEGQDAARSASALNLDLTFFTTTLYKSLHSLALNPDIELSSKTLRLADPDANNNEPLPPSAAAAEEAVKINVKTTSVLLIRCLVSVLTPRTAPPLRIAAFTKQLYTSTLHLPEKSALASLGLLGNTVAKTHVRKLGSLWNTDERKGDGVFDPWGGVAEGSNPFASTVWEGELIRLHYSPGVREAVRGIERGVGASK